MEKNFFEITKNSTAENNPEITQFVLKQDNEAIMIVDAISPNCDVKATGMITQGLAIYAGLKLLADAIRGAKT